VIRFVAGRLLQLVPLLWVVVTLVFVPLRLIPGDPATVLLGVEATEEQRAAFRQRLGLDAPVHVQYLRYLGRLAHGDLGRSISYREEVAVLIGRTLPATLELAAAALGLAMLVAVPLGVLAAVFRGGWLDWLSTLLAVTGAAVPGFWLGVMLILLFSVSLGWLPSTGRAGPPWTADGLRHLVLPAATLALALVASTTRLTRSAMLEVLGDDYVRTARAKGLAERWVLGRHALRNALIPVVTNIGLQAGALLGGALLIETVYGWPGLGRLGVDAMLRRDFPLIQGVVLGAVGAFALVNLAVDCVYAGLDPRIRYDR
jgi:peptide/nickel transport system permease protein